MSIKINEICRTILTVSDEEISEMREIIKGQAEYNHPFKQATNKKLYALAKHNEFVLNSIIETKRLLEAGAPENL